MVEVQLPNTNYLFLQDGDKHKGIEDEGKSNIYQTWIK